MSLYSTQHLSGTDTVGLTRVRTQFDIIHFYKITPEYMVPSFLLAVEVGCKSFNATYLNYILDKQIITILPSVNSHLLIFNMFTFYI